MFLFCWENESDVLSTIIGSDLSSTFFLNLLSIHPNSFTAFSRLVTTQVPNMQIGIAVKHDLSQKHILGSITAFFFFSLAKQGWAYSPRRDGVWDGASRVMWQPGIPSSSSSSGRKKRSRQNSMYAKQSSGLFGICMFAATSGRIPDKGHVLLRGTQAQIRRCSRST